MEHKKDIHVTDLGGAKKVNVICSQQKAEIRNEIEQNVNDQLDLIADLSNAFNEVIESLNLPSSPFLDKYKARQAQIKELINASQ